MRNRYPQNIDVEVTRTALRMGSPAGMKALKDQFSRGIRLYLRRALKSTVVDADVIGVVEVAAQALVSTEDIKSENLLHVVPECARRAAEAATLKVAAPTKQAPQGQMDMEVAVAHALGRSTVLEREALHQFYVEGTDPALVCERTGMSEEDFERLRSNVRSTVFL